MTEKEYYDKVDAEYRYVNELLNQIDSAYGDGYADGYKYAVDEFLNKCKEMVEKTKIARLELFEICEIAEELKTARGSD